MTEEQKTQEKKSTKFELVQVPTQHSLAIQTPEGELVSVEDAIVKILNNIEDIKKGVLG